LFFVVVAFQVQLRNVSLTVVVQCECTNVNLVCCLIEQNKTQATPCFNSLETRTI